MNQTPPDGPDDRPGDRDVPGAQPPRDADGVERADGATHEPRPAAAADETGVLRADVTRAMPAASGPGGPAGGPAWQPQGQPYPGPPRQSFGQPAGQPFGQAPLGQAPSGHQPAGLGPERRNTWMVPAIIGLAIVLVVGAVVFVLTRSGAGPVGAPGEQGVDAPAGGPATAPGAAPTQAETPGDSATTPTGEGDREVSADPLEPRVDKEIVGTGFALSDAGWTEHAAGIEAGAREAVAGTYTDGSVDVPVTAAAFSTIAAQDGYSEQLTGDLEDDGAQLLSEGTVYPDSTGQHWAYMLADGVTTTVVWRTDDGVVLTLSGDPEAVQEIYSNMLI